MLNGDLDESQANSSSQDGSSDEVDDDSKLPLQLAIVGRPNVGKSTLLNALLQEDRVLVGPEAGLTRDSVRVHFEYQGRTVYLVDMRSLSVYLYSNMNYPLHLMKSRNVRASTFASKDEIFLFSGRYCRLVAKN